jgi:3-hydroxyisobutyrate dehydrogenase
MEERTVTRAGIIGLGAMGSALARHMVAKGLRVAGFDIDVDAMRCAVGDGVASTLSPAAVGEGSQVVIVMVATDAQVEDVIAHSGLLDRLAAGSVIGIASSCAPETCRNMEGKAIEKGIGVIDCPLVLGQEAADQGRLTSYVGGEEKFVACARPALAAFCRDIIHIGPVGSGQIAKTVNNMLLWAAMAANFEALTLARALGVDRARLIEALGHGSGTNWSLSRWGKSTGKWAEKDMDVALDLAQEAKVAAPLAGLVDQLMKSINQERMRALLQSS